MENGHYICGHNYRLHCNCELAYAENGEHCNQQNLAVSDMPAAVSKTIQNNLEGGTITETANGNRREPCRVRGIRQEAWGRNLMSVGKEKDDDNEWLFWG
jgi:hypothetical protein